MCRVVSCVVGRGCLLRANAFSWQNFVRFLTKEFRWGWYWDSLNLQLVSEVRVILATPELCKGRKKESEVYQSYLTLCYPVDCSLPGCSVHGIFPGKNIGVGCHFLVQEVRKTFAWFKTQALNPGLLHCRQTLYHLSHQGTLQTCYLFLKANSCVIRSHSWE